MTHQNSAARQEREPSALVFVAKVIFISIAVVLTIVFLAALPEAPWTPLVIALAIALVLGFSVELALRSRRRDQRPSVVRMAGRRDVAFRRPEDCPAQPDNGGSPLDDGSSDTRPGMVGRVLGLFAAIGALCIVLAFLAPPELGVSLAILGLGGFFIVRLAAFHPRGAWRPPIVLDRRVSEAAEAHALREPWRARTAESGGDRCEERAPTRLRPPARDGPPPRREED